MDTCAYSADATSPHEAEEPIIHSASIQPVFRGTCDVKNTERLLHPTKSKENTYLYKYIFVAACARTLLTAAQPAL